MNGKGITMIVLAAVSIIMIGGLLMPIINDYNSDETNTYTNPGTRATLLDLTGTHTLVSDGVTFTIDDNDPITVSNYQVGLASDLFNARRFGTSLQWGSPFGAAISGVLDVTIVDGVVNGTLTSSATSNVYTFTDQKINYLAYVDSNGSYSMVVSDSTPRNLYLNNPSEQFYSANYLSTTSQWFSYYKGVLMVGGEQNDTMTFTGDQLDFDTEVYRYVISQDDISFTVDNGGTDYVVHPYICVVPHEVTGMTLTDHQIFAILYAIPAVLIVAILVGVLAFAMRSRE